MSDINALYYFKHHKPVYWIRYARQRWAQRYLVHIIVNAKTKKKQNYLLKNRHGAYSVFELALKQAKDQ